MTFNFARPELLLLAAILPLLAALYLLTLRARARALANFGGEARVLVSRRVGVQSAKAVLLLVALASLVIALAGPYVDLRPREARRLGVDLVVAVDVSQSMAVRDVEPDRLRAARHVTEELGRQMIGSRVALVLFAGQGTVRYPPTTDPRILGETLDNSGTGVHLSAGTSLRSGVEASLGAFPPEEDTLRKRAIVLISDGEMTADQLPDLQGLQEQGIRVFSVGVGTPGGGPIPTYDQQSGKFTGYLAGPAGGNVTSRLNEDILRLLADRGNGRYWRFVGDDSVIREMAGELRSLEAIEPMSDAGSVPDERSGVAVALAVAAVLAERLLSDRRPMPVPGVAGRTPARRGRRILGIAIGSAVLWALACGESAISNESANALFAAGDYTGALVRYVDLQQAEPNSPELAVNAGNALYMTKEYPRALSQYSVALDAADPKVRAIAYYDRGNALFRLERLDEARESYKAALRLDPNDRDAKFNLELIIRKTDPQQGQDNQPPGQSGPGASQSPGPGQPGQSSQPGAPGSPQPGTQPGTPQDVQSEPTDVRATDQPPPQDLLQALTDFRAGLTLDDALRVLDALRDDQRGVEQLLEGPRSGGNQAEY